MNVGTIIAFSITLGTILIWTISAVIEFELIPIYRLKKACRPGAVLIRYKTIQWKSSPNREIQNKLYIVDVSKDKKYIRYTLSTTSHRMFTEKISKLALNKYILSSETFEPKLINNYFEM